MEKDEVLIKKAASGKLGLHKIQDFVDTDKAVEIRRKAIERLTKTKLEHLAKHSISLGAVTNRNIDNPIGAIQVPVGIAGPLRINGEYAKGEFYIPLATTEGALVASFNRGATAISESGGCTVRIVKEGMSRAPVFKLRNIQDSVKFRDWVNQHFYKFQQIMGEESKFLKLNEIQPFIIGKRVFLRFVCDPSDAMGMNMITIGVNKVIDFIEKEYPSAKAISVTGNLCTDKKTSAMNFILGRGKTVSAEVKIPEKIVKEKLKTTSKNIAEVCYSKNYIGSARAATLGGFNAHVANGVAAIFIACGQDPAQIMNSAMAITTAEAEGDGAYFSILMPSLEVGTVGGGTSIATQREALEILGCYGAGTPPGTNAKKFAEIVCANALAGEISLLSALAAGHLARAHAYLGRGKALK